MARYDDNSKLGTMLDDPEVVAILDKHAPGLTKHPMIGMAKGMTVSQALSMAGGQIPADKVAEIRSEIEQLQ